MSAFDTLRERLTGIKKQSCKPSQEAAFRASCPSCGSGRDGKLSIALESGGRVLLHCFGGCSVSEIVGAAGLELADLFPPRLPGTHAVRGNGGPAHWAGAAGAAEALEEAAIDLMVGSASIFDVLARVESFRRAARIAMREEFSSRKGVAV